MRRGAIHRARAAAALVCLVVLLGGAALSQEPSSPPPPAATAQPASFPPHVVQKAVQAGITVEFAIQAAAPAAKALEEGAEATIRFQITDASGVPLTGLYPVAWMDLRPIGLLANTEKCREKIQAFLQASLAARPTLDLNTSYIVVLNRDATINILDPLIGFGTSRLYGMVTLESPGADWALNADGSRLYVSLPDSHHVAVIDTLQWKVVASLEAGEKPVRLALQPDGRYLWVGNDGAPSGVTVFDMREEKQVASLPTGAGHHEIAFSPDNRYAFITNQEDDSLSVIDIRELKPALTLRTGARPVGLAVSARSLSLYVAHEGDGSIAVVDTQKPEILTRIQAEPGLTLIRFAPGDRWAFVANRGHDHVYVLDASSNRIVHTMDLGKEPDQIAFTDVYAYVRLAGSDEIILVRLNTLGGPEPPATSDFPGGQSLPGASGAGPFPDAIAGVPGEDAAYVANAGDKMVYYYHEGMAAPKGGFQNYGHAPQGVLTVNRNLRETQPGVYTTSVQLPADGHYDVAFFLDSPPVAHCFDVAVAPNPALHKPVAGIDLQPLLAERRLPLGENFPLRFKVTDAATHEPRADLEDLRVLIFLAPGIWQKREWAKPLGDGLYEVTLNAPQPGVYYVFFECPSLHVRFDQLPHLILRAEEKGSAGPAPPGGSPEPPR